VSQRHLYERIRRGFSTVTRPPRPQLDRRIRDAIWGRSAPAPSPLTLPVPPAALVAALLVLALAAAAVLEWPAIARTAASVGRGVSAGVARVLPSGQPPAGRSSAAVSTAPSVPSPSPSLSPSAAPTPEPTQPPAPTPPPPPTAPPATLPGYSCAAQTGGAGTATMTTARVGAQAGYDRFVVEFSGPVPQFEVTLQESASFAQSGGPVSLRGGAGLRVVLRNVTGAGAYSGPSDIRPSFSAIQEARLLSDSQGVVEWAVGIARPACFHAWTLGAPSRLVVDVAAG